MFTYFCHMISESSIQACANDNARRLRLQCNSDEYIVITRALYVKPLFELAPCGDGYIYERRDLTLDVETLLRQHCDGKSRCELKLEWDMWADVTQRRDGVYKGQASFQVNYQCLGKFV